MLVLFLQTINLIFVLIIIDEPFGLNKQYNHIYEGLFADSQSDAFLFTQKPVCHLFGTVARHTIIYVHVIELCIY